MSENSPNPLLLTKGPQNNLEYNELDRIIPSLLGWSSTSSEINLIESFHFLSQILTTHIPPHFLCRLYSPNRIVLPFNNDDFEPTIHGSVPKLNVLIGYLVNIGIIKHINNQLKVFLTKKNDKKRGIFHSDYSQRVINPLQATKQEFNSIRCIRSGYIETVVCDVSHKKTQNDRGNAPNDRKGVNILYNNEATPKSIKNNTKVNHFVDKHFLGIADSDAGYMYHNTNSNNDQNDPDQNHKNFKKLKTSDDQKGKNDENPLNDDDKTPSFGTLLRWSETLRRYTAKAAQLRPKMAEEGHESNLEKWKLVEKERAKFELLFKTFVPGSRGIAIGQLTRVKQQNQREKLDKSTLTKSAPAKPILTKPKLIKPKLIKPNLQKPNTIKPAPKKKPLLFKPNPFNTFQHYLLSLKSQAVAERRYTDEINSNNAKMLENNANNPSNNNPNSTDQNYPLNCLFYPQFVTLNHVLRDGVLDKEEEPQEPFVQTIFPEKTLNWLTEDEKRTRSCPRVQFPLPDKLQTMVERKMKQLLHMRQNYRMGLGLGWEDIEVDVDDENDDKNDDKNGDDGLMRDVDEDNQSGVMGDYNSLHLQNQLDSLNLQNNLDTSPDFENPFNNSPNHPPNPLNASAYDQYGPIDFITVPSLPISASDDYHRLSCQAVRGVFTIEQIADSHENSYRKRSGYISNNNNNGCNNNGRNNQNGNNNNDSSTSQQPPPIDYLHLAQTDVQMTTKRRRDVVSEENAGVLPVLEVFQGVLEDTPQFQLKADPNFDEEDRKRLKAIEDFNKRLKDIEEFNIKHNSQSYKKHHIGDIGDNYYKKHRIGDSYEQKHHYHDSYYDNISQQGLDDEDSGSDNKDKHHFDKKQRNNDQYYCNLDDHIQSNQWTGNHDQLSAYINDVHSNQHQSHHDQSYNQSYQNQTEYSDQYHQSYQNQSNQPYQTPIQCLLQRMTGFDDDCMYTPLVYDGNGGDGFASIQEGLSPFNTKVHYVNDPSDVNPNNMNIFCDIDHTLGDVSDDIDDSDDSDEDLSDNCDDLNYDNVACTTTTPTTTPPLSFPSRIEHPHDIQINIDGVEYDSRSIDWVMKTLVVVVKCATGQDRSKLFLSIAQSTLINYLYLLLKHILRKGALKQRNLYIVATVMAIVAEIGVTLPQYCEEMKCLFSDLFFQEVLYQHPLLSPLIIRCAVSWLRPLQDCNYKWEELEGGDGHYCCE